MAAYDIDAAAVLAAVRDTATELAPLAAAAAGLRGTVDAVEAALGSGRVARAFTAYGEEALLPDLRSMLSRTDDALQGVGIAVAEYVRADEEMRARAEAAAAAVPGSAEQHTEAPFPVGIVPVAPSPLAPPDAEWSGPALPPPPVAPLPVAEWSGPALPPLPVAPLPVAEWSGPALRPLPACPPPQVDPEPGSLVPLPGPPPFRPEWPFRPVLPGRPPIVPFRNLMGYLHFPCPGGAEPPHWYGGCGPGPHDWTEGCRQERPHPRNEDCLPERHHPHPQMPGKNYPEPGPVTDEPDPEMRNYVPGWRPPGIPGPPRNYVPGWPPPADIPEPPRNYVPGWRPPGIPAPPRNYVPGWPPPADFPGPPRDLPAPVCPDPLLVLDPGFDVLPGRDGDWPLEIVPGREPPLIATPLGGGEEPAQRYSGGKWGLT